METPCEIWTGTLNAEGYARQGAVRFGTQLAYRIRWIEKNGPVPEGLELDHLCRNRACVNPDHLEPVTHLENVRRSAAGLARISFNKARGVAIERCPAGHAYDEANTFVYTNPRTGWTMRHCRACDNARKKAKRAERAAAAS